MFLQKLGCCGNTCKFYFKALRAILNRANTEGIGSAAPYPFGQAGFEVSKLEEATAKRYLHADESPKLTHIAASNTPGHTSTKLSPFTSLVCEISSISMSMLPAAHIKTM